jgi:uncharacterized protein
MNCIPLLRIISKLDKKGMIQEVGKTETIKKIEVFVKERLKGFDSGHDWWHIDRVRRLAKYINQKELMADPFTLDIAVLLHDTVDSKFMNGETVAAYTIIEDLLDNTGLGTIKDQVIGAIKNVSFSNKNRSGNLQDPVYLIMQDADRLDAIGAIGVARAFNYGGFINNPIYIPDEIISGLSKSTIGHFYDKLLRLSGLMNTKTGKELAEERHRYLEDFLKKFYGEWNFGDE